MKLKNGKHFKRIIAFVVALATIASASMTASFATQNDTKNEVVKHVDDLRSVFPGLTENKMQLSDPAFSEKNWYEYIDYTFYTDVVDGDMTYRIYKPTNFSSASVMAIGDYNPKEVLGNTTNLSMNLGELQTIFDMAQQGSNISKDFVGLDMTNGIAKSMNSVSSVMDNSKYYSNSSFLGIPGDKKYTGVSNDGFFNASQLSIEIVESETVSACKTVSADSAYTISENYETSKDKSTYKEASNAVTNQKEDVTTNGVAISNATSKSSEIGQSISDSIGYEQTVEDITSDSSSHKTTNGVDFGTNMSAQYGVAGSFIEAGMSMNITKGSEDETSHSNQHSNASTISSSRTEENSASITNSSEQTISANIDQSHSDSTSIENSMTNGSNNTTGQKYAKDVSLNLGYGVDYQYGNEHSLSVGVTRTFAAREDEK